MGLQLVQEPQSLLRKRKRQAPVAPNRPDDGCAVGCPGTDERLDRWEDADSELIFGDALAPVCSPALARTLRSPADLASHNLLHSMMRSDAWELWLAGQALGGLRAKRATKLANAAVSYQAAIDGLGIALAQLAYVREYLDAGSLVMPFDRILRTGAGYYLASARRRANQPQIRLFRSWIRDVPKDGMGARI